MLNITCWIRQISLIVAAALLSGCTLTNDTTLQNALVTFSTNFPALWQMSTGGAYVLGFVMLFRAVFQLKQYGEATASRASGTSIKGPAILFIAGTALMFFPTVKSTLLMSTFGYGQEAQLGYDTSGGDILTAQSMHALLALIQLVGVISFIRGWVQLSHLSNPGRGQESVGKAATHILGGIMAVNIQGTIQMFQVTFGFN